MAGCAQLPSFHMRLQGRAGTATAGASGSGPPGREDLHEGPPAPASRGSRSPSAPVPLAHPGGIGTTGWAARPRGPRHVDASGSGPLAENPGRVRKARPLRPPRASVHQTPPPVTRCRAGGGAGGFGPGSGWMTRLRVAPPSVAAVPPVSQPPAGGPPVIGRTR